MKLKRIISLLTIISVFIITMVLIPSIFDDISTEDTCADITYVENTDTKVRVLPIAGVEEVLQESIPDKSSDIELISTSVPNTNNIIKKFTRYTKCKVNVRSKPSTKSKIIDTLDFNTKVKCSKYNDEWFIIYIDKNEYYISKQFLSKEEISYKEYDVPSNTGMKSWMPYTAITSRSSPQKKLQDNYAYSGDYGIRMIDNRFCVALGSYFNCSIGQYFTLVLENDTMIPCVMSDSKADKDTDSSNIFTNHNGCMSEFIVNRSLLNHNAKVSGDISSVDDSWKSPVVKVIVYDYNVLK